MKETLELSCLIAEDKKDSSVKQHLHVYLTSINEVPLIKDEETLEELLELENEPNLKQEISTCFKMLCPVVSDLVLRPFCQLF